MNYQSDNRRHVDDYVKQVIQQCFDHVDHLDWVIGNVCVKYNTVRLGLITLVLLLLLFFFTGCYAG